jgi:hypothetical protein
VGAGQDGNAKKVPHRLQDKGLVDCWFATKKISKPYVSLSWLIAWKSKNNKNVLNQML